MKNKIFLVIDGNSVAHRAFHAMPALTNKKGQALGAVHGFMLALIRAVDDFAPDYLAVCFDTKGGTFRNRDFAAYKAQRPKTPPELIEQLAAIKELLPKLGAAVFALEGFEADDLIASVLKIAQNEIDNGVDFYILTGDHDSLQLVDPRVKVMMVNRGIKNAVVYDAAKVEEIFGVAPDQIPAFKALAGDASDNIPGAPGIGPKAAIEILNRCGGLEKAFADIENGGPDLCFGSGARAEKIKTILCGNKKEIINFQNLATMVADAPLGEVAAKCVFKNFSGESSKAALLELGLAGIAGRMPQPGAGRNQTLF